MTDIQLGYKLTEAGVIPEDWVVKLLFLVPTRRDWLLSKHKLGKDNYYLNDALYELLHNVGSQSAGVVIA